MRMLLSIFLATTTQLLFSSPLSAQLVGGQWETSLGFDGQAAMDQFGVSVAGAGDVDGDGFGDVIVGAFGADPGGLSDAGSAFVFSGDAGGLLWQFGGLATDDYLGYSVSGAGDVDGDGFDDLVVGAFGASPRGQYWAGAAYVYSGSTGSLLWQFDGQATGDQLGRSVSGAGDVDGDGVSDVIVGAYLADPAGRSDAGSAFVYSGSSGLLLWQFDGQAAGDQLGRSVSGAGDVDGDGFDDLIVGAIGASPGGMSWAGSANVYSGASGSLIWQFHGQAADDFFGRRVSDAGDVDRDGRADVIVGAVGTSPGGVFWAGSAFVFSGASGNLIWQFDGQSSGDWLGSSVSGAGDVDGDGFDDLIIGAENADPGGLMDAGSTYVYSGASGNLICQFDGQAAGDRLGSSVASAGDINGDGLQDLIVGAELADPGGLVDAGIVSVFCLDPFLHLGAAELSASGSSSAQLSMDFPASEAGQRYAVLASITGTGPIVMGGLDIPLTQDYVFNTITSGSVPSVLQGAFGTLDANGEALASLSTGPALNRIIGQTIYFAAVTYDVGPMTGRVSSIVRYLSIVP
jgi:hypothetical protein